MDQVLTFSFGIFRPRVERRVPVHSTESTMYAHVLCNTTETSMARNYLHREDQIQSLFSYLNRKDQNAWITWLSFVYRTNRLIFELQVVELDASSLIEYLA